MTPEALMMDPLIATEPDGRLVPILAQTVPTLENGGIGRDGVTITYHLRHGVKWQDGAPFTSHDVAFTVSALNNPKTLVGSRHGYDQIARVDTPDPYTAVFRLKHPFAPAVNTFFAHSDAPYFVLPAHLLEQEPDLNHVAFNEHPIGTGPFKLVRWYRGDRIEFAANDDYFLGKPKLRKISLRIIPDENTAINQLRAHEVDWIALATPRMYPQLKTIPGVDVRLVPFNGNDAIQFNTQRAPFDDARVRRAIGLALDKPRLSHEVTFDTTVPAPKTCRRCCGRTIRTPAPVSATCPARRRCSTRPAGTPAPTASGCARGAARRWGWPSAATASPTATAACRSPRCCARPASRSSSRAIPRRSSTARPAPA